MKHEKNQSNYNYQHLTFILISTRNSSLIKIQIKPITNVRCVLRIKKMLNDNAFSLKDLVFCSLPPPTPIVYSPWQLLRPSRQRSEKTPQMYFV